MSESSGSQSRTKYITKFHKVKEFSLCYFVKNSGEFWVTESHKVYHKVSQSNKEFSLCYFVKDSGELCVQKSLDSNLLKVTTKIQSNDENEFEFYEDLTMINIIPLKHYRYL